MNQRHTRKRTQANIDHTYHTPKPQLYQIIFANGTRIMGYWPCIRDALAAKIVADVVASEKTTIRTITLDLQR